MSIWCRIGPPDTHQVLDNGCFPVFSRDLFVPEVKSQVACFVRLYLIIKHSEWKYQEVGPPSDDSFSYILHHTFSPLTAFVGLFASQAMKFLKEQTLSLSKYPRKSSLFVARNNSPKIPTDNTTNGSTAILDQLLLHFEEFLDFEPIQHFLEHFKVFNREVSFIRARHHSGNSNQLIFETLSCISPFQRAFIRHKSLALQNPHSRSLYILFKSSFRDCKPSNPFVVCGSKNSEGYHFFLNCVVEFLLYSESSHNFKDFDSDSVSDNLEDYRLLTPFSLSALARLHRFLEINFPYYEHLGSMASSSPTTPNMDADLPEFENVPSEMLDSEASFIPSVLLRQVETTGQQEEGRMFSQFGTKFRDTMEKIKLTEFRRKIKEKMGYVEKRSLDIAEDEEAKNALTYGKKPDRKDAVEECKLFSAALMVPAYAIFRDENGCRSIPVVLSHLKIQIPQSDDSLISFTNYTTFKINIEYPVAKIKWTIYRRTIDFIRLHLILSLRHYQGHLPKLPRFPSQISYFLDFTSMPTFLSAGHERRRSYRKLMLASAARRAALKDYILDVLYCLHMHISTEVCEFLEISTASIRKGICWKGKEGYLLNRVERPLGSTLNYFEFCKDTFLPEIVRRKKFESQWFIIRCSYVAFMDSIDKFTFKDVILCDSSFRLDIQHREGLGYLFRPGSSFETPPLPLGEIQHTQAFKGGQFMPKSFLLINSSQQVEVRAEKDYQMFYWIHDIQRLTLESTYCKINRYNSFSPVRPNQEVEWFVDGHDYFERLVSVILAAKKEIFIEGWWVTPELYLKRPPEKYPEYRLDNLLLKKAQEGVMIYIFLFKEVTVALPIDSAYSKQVFSLLHPNIRVQRHPDHVIGGIVYWAHHEKIVVIDQKIAFIGGLDLCYGRYDTRRHKLLDYKPTVTEIFRPTRTEPPVKMRIADQDIDPNQVYRLGQGGPGSKSSSYEDLTSLLDEESRSLRTPLEGVPFKSNASRHDTHGGLDVDSCNHLSGTDVCGKALFCGNTPVTSSTKSSHNGSPISASNDDTLLLSASDALSGTDPMMADDVESFHYVWHGLDYSNPRIKDFRQVRNPDLHLLDRSFQPRMPWHDLHCMVFGVTSHASHQMTGATPISQHFTSARDIGRHFIQKWNFCKREKSMHKEFLVPFLTPDEDEITYKDLADLLGDETLLSGEQLSMQVVRSASSWTVGISATEKSLQEAYIQGIRNSEHYIYIENQFFISRILNTTLSDTEIQHIVASHEENPEASCSSEEAEIDSLPSLDTTAVNNAKPSSNDLPSSQPNDIETGSAPPSVPLAVSAISSTTFQNLIGNALFDRILLAYRRKETFRVYIVLPLLPAFEADVAVPQASSVRIIMQAQLSTIRKGPNSLLSLLEAYQVPVDQYITFLSLRAYEALSCKSPETDDPHKEHLYLTEQIYVHSKCMIVDDRQVIIGSANINDRSMVGDKDGEIAIVISQDPQNCEADGLMNHVSVKVSQSIRSFRYKIWAEHLGLQETDPNDVAMMVDPISSEFYDDFLRSRAIYNTRLYRDLFRCLPDDTVLTWDKYHAFPLEKPSLLSLPGLSLHPDRFPEEKHLYEELVAKLAEIKGHFVMHPCCFLLKEDLGASILSKEYLLPSEVYY